MALCALCDAPACTLLPEQRHRMLKQGRRLEARLRPRLCLSRPRSATCSHRSSRLLAGMQLRLSACRQVSTLVRSAPWQRLLVCLGQALSSSSSTRHRHLLPPCLTQGSRLQQVRLQISRWISCSSCWPACHPQLLCRGWPVQHLAGMCSSRRTSHGARVGRVRKIRHRNSSKRHRSSRRHQFSNPEAHSRQRRGLPSGGGLAGRARVGRQARSCRRNSAHQQYLRYLQYLLRYHLPLDLWDLCSVFPCSERRLFSSRHSSMPIHCSHPMQSWGAHMGRNPSAGHPSNKWVEGRPFSSSRAERRRG